MVTTVYLDTSGWNALYDWASTRGPKRLLEYEYLFSSCDLDEFGFASASRAKSLAGFAWRISTPRRKLLDHLELTASEIAAWQRRADVDYFDSDPGFLPAWRGMKAVGVTMEMQASIAEHMGRAKREYQEYLRLHRSLFGPIFRRARDLGVVKDWPTLLDEFREGTEVPDMIEGYLRSENLLRLIPRPAELGEVPWPQLPGTACWVEYYLALDYSASFGTRKLGAAERGDQFDYRHACYAGIADIFITEDARMHAILTGMVLSRRARVLRPDEFLDEVASLQPQLRADSAQAGVD